jgi:hypothetical protein
MRFRLQGTILAWNPTEPSAFLWRRNSHLAARRVVMTKADDYRRLAEEAGARVDWCEKKLAFESKRHKALKDLAAGEDWLDGKVNPTATTKTEGSASGS